MKEGAKRGLGVYLSSFQLPRPLCPARPVAWLYLVVLQSSKELPRDGSESPFAKNWNGAEGAKAFPVFGKKAKKVVNKFRIPVIATNNRVGCWFVADSLW